MLVVSALCLAACADDPDVAPLKRDTDVVELTYNANATSQVSVRYDGSWSARVECLDEASGTPVNNSGLLFRPPRVSATAGTTSG